METRTRTGALAGSRVGLHWFAVFTTLCTFVLIATGGLVTSKGVGMAVPDWPTTFGYNMFAFPISRWVGGVFYEHFHRLVASGVGLLTVILAVWAFIVEPRRWVKMLVVWAVIAVVVQGLFGGLRVTMIMKELGVIHGWLAQSFFVLLGVITAATSKGFVNGTWAPAVRLGGLRWLALAVSVLVFFQLGMGALMRHAHLGIAIPDFPAAYGGFLPDTSADRIEAINVARVAAGEMPTTAFQIWLQWTHRGMAVVIAAGVFLLTWKAGRLAGCPTPIRAWTKVLSGLILVQIGLGAWTVWSNKAADIATSHMALGALLLLFLGVLTFRLFVSDRRTIDPGAGQGLTRRDLVREVAA